MIKDGDVSRAISHALRHEPWIYELELDDEGWTELDSLIGALRECRVAWEGLSRQDVERAIASSEKRRHEISGNRIRALYGHSLPGKLQKVAASPPALLYHGTSPEAVQAILLDGLKPMGRQYVHLSNELAMAEKVGQRKSRMPIMLSISAGAAYAEGVAFYSGNETVWLADAVPARFISRPGSSDRDIGSERGFSAP